MKKLLMLICLTGLAFLSVQSANIPLYGQLPGSGLVKKYGRKNIYLSK